MMKTILWILTTTKDTPKTTDYVLAHAKSQGIRLIVLLVLDSKLGQEAFRKLEQESFFGGGQSAQLTEMLIQDYEERGRRKFADIELCAAENKVPVETRLKRGDTAEECAAVIRECQPDEIVLTRMHDSRFSRFFFSGPAEKIKSSAVCPVTVIDDKEKP